MNLQRSLILLTATAIATGGCANRVGVVDPRETELRAALDRPLVGTVVFRDATRGEVADRLSRATGLTVVFDGAIAGSGNSLATQPVGDITANVTGLVLGDAIARLRTDAKDDPFDSFAGTVRNGVVTITWRAHADRRNLIFCTYDVRDLIDSATSYDVHGTTLVEPGNLCFPPEVPAMTSAHERSTHKLIDVIKDAIGHEEWSDGDGYGTASEYAGRLVVLQTPQNHQRIRVLLAQLRHPVAP